MIYTHYTQHSTENQEIEYRQGRLICLSEPPPAPDWNNPEFAGALRCMFWAARRDLPSLFDLAVNQFAITAREWRP